MKTIPIALYRPSNGTEGEAFISEWCGNCARDLSANGTKDFDDCEEHELCDIIARSFAHDESEPEYPREWVEDDDGPRCTAFVPKDQPVPPPKCEHTLELPL